MSEPTATNSLSTAELGLIADVMVRTGSGLAGPLSASLISGGKSNLTFRLTDGVSAWVMRTPPRVGRIPSAHDVAREFRVTAALSSTCVPVPRPIVLEEDEGLIGGPFAIAEFVRGRTIQTRVQLDELTDREVGAVSDELVAVLATLHAVDYAAIGLERLGRPDVYFGRQLKRWAGQWELVARPAVLEAGRAIATRLGERVPEQRATGIVHGDFRIDNTLLSLDSAAVPRISAVVDWELSTLGDPVADVAMMCAYRDPAFDLIVGAPSAWTSPRLADPLTLAGLYESAGGVRLADFDTQLALAYFKIGVIAAGIDHRLRAGAVSGDGFASAGDSVQLYLDLARRALAVSG
jgi:aminoglycoside phosphotransferase (APT) family kinase protein